ncbi:MAG: hypothetical protein NTZ51_03755 [Proteobacteria bacterium]|nr:hypothetical protein [Pseudomonadota bacterium]
MRQKTVSSSTPLVKKLDARSSRRSFAFLYITNECNLTCAHCSFQSAPDKKYSHMDTGLLLRLMDELQGVHDITLTGGLYINCKGVYLNEASLLLDRRQGIETPLKIGTLNPVLTNRQQLFELYTRYRHKVKI